MCAFVANLPVEAVPDDQVLESGWEELGISDDRAAEIASELADEEGAPGGIDFYKVRTWPYPSQRQTSICFIYFKDSVITVCGLYRHELCSTDCFICGYII